MVRGDWNRNGRDRRDDRRGNGGGSGWNGGSAWNAGRRFDDRTRWQGQRRWDNGWRNDRRYDWYSYRARYGDRYRIGRYYAPRGWSYGYSRFSIGIFLNSLRSEEHTSELQSLMRISYAVFCLKKKTQTSTLYLQILDLSLIL